nr:GATA transcription factor GATAc [Hymenolepis microstoma]
MESEDINGISLKTRSSNYFGNNQSWNNCPIIEEKAMKIEEPFTPLNRENSVQEQSYRTEGDLFALNGLQRVENNYYNTYCFESTQIPHHYARCPECVNCGRANSKSWSFDKGGNSLCIDCSNQMCSRYSTAHDSLTTSTPKHFTQCGKKLDRLPPNFNVKNGTICSNCQTSKTSLWRRAPEGDVVCNACGLYRKMHGRQRPLTMRKDSIQTRKRRSIKKHSDDLSEHRQSNPSVKPVPRKINIPLINYQDRLNINKDFQAAFGPQHNFQSHNLPYGEMSQESFPTWCPESTGIPQPLQQRFPDVFYSNYQPPYFPTENDNNLL